MENCCKLLIFKFFFNLGNGILLTLLIVIFFLHNVFIFVVTNMNLIFIKVAF